MLQTHHKLSHCHIVNQSLACTLLSLPTESVDPAERDAALTMCMISGGSEGDLSESLATVYHDHSYCKKVVKPPVTVRLPRRRKKM